MTTTQMIQMIQFMNLVLCKVNGERIPAIQIVRAAGNAFAPEAQPITLKWAKDLQDATCVLYDATKNSGWMPQRAYPILSEHLAHMIELARLIGRNSMMAVVVELGVNSDQAGPVVDALRTLARLRDE
jgi:hypothetical protein